MKRLLPLLLVLLWGQNILWAQKGVLLRTQSESYAIDNQTDSLLNDRKESREYYTFLRFNRRIEEKTPKNEATYTQEMYFSGEKFIEEGKNTQYGLNITTFYTETIEKVKNKKFLLF